jgi:hypothetical protein
MRIGDHNLTSQTNQTFEPVTWFGSLRFFPGNSFAERGLPGGMLWAKDEGGKCEFFVNSQRDRGVQEMQRAADDK